MATSNYTNCYSYVDLAAPAISISDFPVKVNIDIDMIAENGDKIKEKVQEHKEYQKRLEEKAIVAKNKRLRQMVKHVQFSGNRCIIFWNDGTQTKSVWNENEYFDPEKAILVAMVRKLYEDTGLYNEVLQKYYKDGLEACEDYLSKKNQKLEDDDDEGWFY